MFTTLAFLAVLAVAGIFLRKVVLAILSRADAPAPVQSGTGALPSSDEDTTKKIIP